jgi:histone deacetylase complex regulatory component SIN3
MQQAQQQSQQQQSLKTMPEKIVNGGMPVRQPDSLARHASRPTIQRTAPPGRSGVTEKASDARGRPIQQQQSQSRDAPPTQRQHPTQSHALPELPQIKPQIMSQARGSTTMPPMRKPQPQHSAPALQQQQQHASQHVMSQQRPVVQRPHIHRPLGGGISQQGMPSTGQGATAQHMQSVRLPQHVHQGPRSDANARGHQQLSRPTPRPAHMPSSLSQQQQARSVPERMESSRVHSPPAWHQMQQPMDVSEPAMMRQELQQQDQQPPAPSAADTSARRQLKVEDALAYLEQVKTQFDGKPTVYNLFLDIMKEFKAQCINTTEVIKRVSHLFSGHRSLILGFNTFLPPGYKIEVRENAQGMLSTGFSGPGGFSELPLQVKAPDARPYSPATSSHAVAAGGIARSSSPGQAITGTSTAPAAHAAHASSSTTKRRPVASPRRKKPSSTAASGGNYMSLGESTVAEAGASLKMEQVSSRATGNPSLEAVDTSGITGGLVDPCLGIARPAKPTDMQAACDLFEKLTHRGLSKRELDLIVDHLKKTVYTSPDPPTLESLVSSMVEFVGDRNKDTLLAFLEHVPTPIGAPTTEGSNKRIVSRGLAPRRGGPGGGSETNKGRPGGTGTARVSATSGRGSATLFFEEARRELGGVSSQLYLDFIKCVSLFSHEIVSRDELITMAADLLRDKPNVYHMFVQHLESAMLGLEDVQNGADSSASSAAVGHLANGPAVGEDRAESFRSKPVSEIAGESGIACSASYRKLPADYPTLACSGRSLLEKKTLNDVWVSVTSGSEDYSFRFMRKNAFEDNLFRCEDDRYELDLVIETNAATILKLEPIAATIAKLPSGVKQRHFLADGALSAINFTAIQRIYGENGPDVVQQVKLNPAVAVPVVLARLRDKDEHWRRARAEMNVIWREVGEKNYHRSLDHRSHYFKQCDKKELSSKSLLADIMNPAASHAARQAEMTRARGYASAGGKPNDRSPANDAVAMLAALGETDAVPSLELPYEEEDVHRIVYSLVSASIMAGAREDANDASKAALACYRQVLHAFFGVSVFGEEADVMECVDELRNQLGQVVMYGDESIYIFFRLHHLVFERLTAAKQMAAESAEDQQFRKTCDELGEKRVAGMKRMPKLKTAPSELTKDLQAAVSGPDAAPFQLNGGILSSKELFEEFMLLLREFLAGSLDSARYEDRCRVILGADSYSLSTLDKALSRLSKQVSHVFGPDALTSVFFDLFHKSRDNIAAAKNDEDHRGIEELYTIAATSTLRKVRGAGASVFRLQHVRRGQSEGRPGKSDDQLVIHVIGMTTTDGDETKRAEESAAIEKFISFGVGFQSVTDYADMLNTPPETGKGRKTGDGEREGKTEAMVVDSDDVGVAKRGLDMADCGPNGSKRRRTSKVKLATELARFAGPASRILDNKFIISNEIECRVGPERRLMFVDGKLDVLVNLGRKRKWGALTWESGESSQLSDLSAWRTRANEASLSSRKFRSFVKKHCSCPFEPRASKKLKSSSAGNKVRGSDEASATAEERSFPVESSAQKLGPENCVSVETGPECARDGQNKIDTAVAKDDSAEDQADKFEAMHEIASDPETTNPGCPEVSARDPPCVNGTEKLSRGR